jgi:hypothetical protein
MQDYLISLALSVMFTLIKSVVKNQQSRIEMRKALLKLFISIRAAYPNDPDFE